jgi:hypothetical protein
MRLPRVRFTVRRLMASVAIVAFILWAERLLRLPREYRDRAGYYSQCEFDASGRLAPGNPRDRAVVDHYHSLHEKYERAARYPWLPIAPDPPEPE